jgi:hypothetical protein
MSNGAWEDEVHIIGPNNAATKYFYDGRVHLIAGMYCFAPMVLSFITRPPFC